MKRIEGHSDLVKTESGAVITVNETVYERAKKKKLERERLNNLENKMERIEKLLEQLVNK